MITVQMFNDLVKNAFVAWSKARAEFPSVRNQLAVIESTQERSPEFSRMSSVQTARERTDGDDAWKGSLKQSYKKTFTQTEIALQYDVTYQTRLFDKYAEIMRAVRENGRGAERRMEFDLAAFLYHAWDSSYTNIDGKTVTTAAPDGTALIYTLHTCNGSSNTFSNEIGTTHSPIDQDVLEKLEEKFNGMLDDADGRNIPIMPDTIITGRHAPTVHVVKRILNSEFYTENANHSANTVKNYQHLIVPFLDVNPQTEARNSSMSRYCFLAALKNKDENGLRMVKALDVQFVPPEQVLESGVWSFLTHAVYDTGLTSANWIVGTKGTGVAV